MAAVIHVPSQTRVRTVSNDESEFEKITEIRKTSGAKASHCIETIDELNEKISQLTSDLDCFSSTKESQLIIEKFEKLNEDSYSSIGVNALQSSTTNERTIASQDSERKQLDKFAGFYAVYTTFGKDLISAANSSSKSNKLSHKKAKQPYGNQGDTPTSKKPMLVELHSFPGFDEVTLTPLPSSLNAMTIAKLITMAQNDLNRKPSFKKAFEKFFCHSSAIRAIIQDTFWWYFCNKYQPNSWAQGNIFDRISRNYMNVVVKWAGCQYQEPLFERLPDFVCQAVYAIFCHAFPESYKQFDDVFRDTLINTVYQWMVGTKPSPRSWKAWNFEKLEPAKMRKREQMEEDASRAKMMEFDITSLTEEVLHRRRQSKAHWQKASRLGATTMRRRRGSRLADLVDTKFRGSSLAVGSDQASADSLNSRKHSTLYTKASGQQRCSSTITDCSRRGTLNTVSEGRRGRSEQRHAKNESSNAERHQNLSPGTPVKIQNSKNRRESCVAGTGAEFNKVVFDVFGRSPLIEHYLRSKNLSRDSGCIVFVQRTEIQSLPPLSAPTYREIIKSSLKKSRLLATKFRSSQEEHVSERSRQLLKWKEAQLDYKRRCISVLENPKEVRKLSDLLRHQVDSEDEELRISQLNTAREEAMGYGDNF